MPTKKKSPAQLDRDIASIFGKHIDRRKLAEMMSPWDQGSVYAVSSYYYGGKKYPDRNVVEKAIAQIEADVPRAERGEYGWTKSDAKDLRTIAAGLRYYLRNDYDGAGSSKRAHATRRTALERGQRVVVLDSLGNEIGRGQVHSGDNYPEPNEHFTYVKMTRHGETATEAWPTDQVRSIGKRAHATKRRATEEVLGVDWSDLAPTGIRVQTHSGDMPLEDATPVEIRKDMNRRLSGYRALTHVPFRRKKWALAVYELAQAKPWVMDQVPHDVWGLVLADVGRGPRP